MLNSEAKLWVTWSCSSRLSVWTQTAQQRWSFCSADGVKAPHCNKYTQNMHSRCPPSTVWVRPDSSCFSIWVSAGHFVSAILNVFSWIKTYLSLQSIWTLSGSSQWKSTTWETHAEFCSDKVDRNIKINSKWRHSCEAETCREATGWMLDISSGQHWCPTDNTLKKCRFFTSSHLCEALQCEEKLQSCKGVLQLFLSPTQLRLERITASMQVRERSSCSASH